MVNKIDAIALFRLSVLGPLASRDHLPRGELKKIIATLAAQTYQHPNGRPMRFTEKTIERWYYCWKKHGIDGLSQSPRSDKNDCQLPSEIQEAILSAKKENRFRSINTLIKLLETQGKVKKNELSRSTIHRLLKKHDLSRRGLNEQEKIERRAFEALHAGDLWHGDVMHGPRIQTDQGVKKVYLVTVFDDASRLVCHSAFCFDETALSIEYILKEALLKRGLPKKLIVDNGPAYRSDTLQAVCARLKIRLIYARPYEPESKGKLERWHRTVREQFLSEIDLDAIHGLDAFNARLWVWIEKFYHETPHSSFKKNVTPLMRFQQDILKIQPLGPIAQHIDDYFYHRIKRSVKKDGTLSYQNTLYEVSFDLVGKSVYMVFDPHQQTAKWIESLDGERISDVFALDKQANNERQRHRPQPAKAPSKPQSSLIELAYDKAKKQFDIK
jgi:putative transposase